MGFAWANGDPMTIKVLQCHAEPKIRSRVLHRGTIVLRALNYVGYNYALQPKSDAYFSVKRPLDGAVGEAVPLVPLGIVNAPDNVILEGGQKRNMPLRQSSSVKRPGRPTATISAVVDKPSSTVDYYSAMDDQEDMDGYGATDERYWDEMDNEEV